MATLPHCPSSLSLSLSAPLVQLRSPGSAYCRLLLEKSSMSVFKPAVMRMVLFAICHCFSQGAVILIKMSVLNCGCDRKWIYEYTQNLSKLPKEVVASTILLMLQRQCDRERAQKAGLWWTRLTNILENANHALKHPLYSCWSHAENTTDHITALRRRPERHRWLLNPSDQ